MAEFLDVFQAYNRAVWPLQVVFYLVAFLSILFMVRRKGWSDKIISFVLSFFWLWMGLVYHLLFFININKAAYYFGFFFILQGFLFLFYGVYKNKLSFQFNQDVLGITGLLLIVFALFFYPLIGYTLGRRFPYNPTFGLPCPTTIFTLGVLLWANKKVPAILLVIPFLWSLLGFTAAVSLDIYEDSGLLVASLIALPLLLMKNRSYAINRL